MTATSSIADVVDERAREMYLDTYEALTPAAAAGARATIHRGGGACRATLRDGKRRERAPIERILGSRVPTTDEAVAREVVGGHSTGRDRSTCPLHSGQSARARDG